METHLENYKTRSLKYEACPAIVIFDISVISISNNQNTFHTCFLPQLGVSLLTISSMVVPPCLIVSKLLEILIFTIFKPK